MWSFFFYVAHCYQQTVKLQSSTWLGKRLGPAVGGQKRRHYSTVHGCYLTMKVRVGIVGLPNVGKSSFFNALSRQTNAVAANYPFATIEPNISPIIVPDPYLESLGKHADSQKTTPATIQFYDVAGLVQGASRGEGLGNQFLATIRETDAVCHLVRFFENDDIVHVNGAVDPIKDAEVINLELILADLAHVERRLEKTTCKGDEREVLTKIRSILENGQPARSAKLSIDDLFCIKSMGLLTLKPVVYVFNVDEVDFLFDRDGVLGKARKIVDSIQYCDASTTLFTVVSAKFESEIATKTNEDRNDYLESLGLDLTKEGSEGESIDALFSYNVIPSMIQQLLDVSLIYTGPGVPPERSRTTKAHILQQRQGTSAYDLAGKLHGDIQKGFIRAEVIDAKQLLEHESFVAAKEAGCVRTEGRDYLMQPNDVIFIRWK